MKNKKITSAKKTRRNPAKTIATKSNNNPPIIRKEHIPPIELGSGSVFLFTHAEIATSSIRAAKAGFAGRQIFHGCKKIIGVRVIMTDGTIKADFKNDPIINGCKIQIWVSNPGASDPDMLFVTRGNSELEVNFTGDHIMFSPDNDSIGSHQRKRHNYSGNNRGILRVKILNNNDTLAEFKTDEDHEQVIDRILIWTDMG